MKKIGIPSDGLDAMSMAEIVKKNVESIGNLTHGFGTGLTNNTK